MDNTADFYSANASSILARPTNFCLKEFKMSFGEANNRFFWKQYDVWLDYELQYDICPADSWVMFCMGGEL